MKQSHWLLCVAKNWSRKIAPLSNLNRASHPVEWKLTAKAKLNCETYKSYRKCCIIQVSFCHQSSPVNQKLWFCLEYCKGWKYTRGKLATAVNLEAIRFEFSRERSVGVSLKYCGRHHLAATQLAVSCSELYFGRCCVLKRTETFATGTKYFIWFYERVMFWSVAFPTSISV